MEPFTRALEAVAGVMRDGAASHPDNDWVGRGLNITSAAPNSVCGSCAKATSGRTIYRMRPRACSWR